MQLSLIGSVSVDRWFCEHGVLLLAYMPALRLTGSCALLLWLASTPSTYGIANTVNPSLVMPLAPKLGLFVADFDDTVTSGDTTPLLPLIAAYAAPEEQKTAIETVWSGLTDSFLQSYYGALQTNVANHKEFTLEGFLLALEEAELASIHRVSDSKVSNLLTRVVNRAQIIAIMQPRVLYNNRPSLTSRYARLLLTETASNNRGQVALIELYLQHSRHKRAHANVPQQRFPTAARFGCCVWFSST
jgi:hypothetical protein